MWQPLSCSQGGIVDERSTRLPGRSCSRRHHCQRCSCLSPWPAIVLLLGADMLRDALRVQAGHVRPSDCLRELPKLRWSEPGSSHQGDRHVACCSCEARHISAAGKAAPGTAEIGRRPVCSRPRFPGKGAAAGLSHVGALGIAGHFHRFLKCKVL